MERFDGRAAWEKLDEETRAAIGAVALELAVTWLSLERVEGRGAIVRALDNAEVLLANALENRVSDVLPDLTGDGLTPLVASQLGRVCGSCGCSDEFACDGGCSWVGPALCSSCQGGAEG